MLRYKILLNHFSRWNHDKNRKTQIIGMLILIIMYALIGCTTPTKPNTPNANVHSAILVDLAEHNYLVAAELRKLPEIQDRISGSDNTVLEKIAEIYGVTERLC